MKKILLIFAFLLAFLPSMKGQTGQIGTGTTTNNYLPIYSYFGYNYSQQIYTASEVTTALGANVYITAIRFYVTTLSTGAQSNFNGWTVYMGNTTQNNFATTTSWVPLSNLQQVYTGTLPTMSSGAWVEIPLTTPFVWDGVSNLVIAVDENTPDYSAAQAWGAYPASTGTDYRGILYYADGTNPDPASPPAASTRYTSLPRVQFVSNALQPCTTAPPAGLAVANTTATSTTASWTPSGGANYVLRYRSLPGGTWTTVNINNSLQSSYTINGLTELTNYEIQIATVCGGTQGAFSSLVNFTTPAIAWCPHAAQYTSATYGWISNVTVNPIGSATVNNTSTQSQYTDFSANPALQVTYVRGTQNNPISIGKTWSGTTYGNYAQVWIDFDRSGTFEPSEKVYDSGLSTASPVTGGINIPQVTYNGPNATKMRVILSYSATATACSGNTYGEVEDYAVKFIDPVACSSAAPTGLVVSNLTPSTATLSWMPAQGATYSVQWRAVTTPASAWTTVTPNPTISTHSLSNLGEQVQYEFRVAYICAGVTGNYATPVQFTTPQISYCTTGPSFTTTVYEYISNVTVSPTGMAQMVSTSQIPPPFYSDYTLDPARQITLIRGTANNSISVTKVYPNSTWSAGTRAWIDWNRNGVFEASEIVLEGASNTNTLVTNPNFTVPAAGSGIYMGTLPVRMRVVLQESGLPSGCGSFSYGEVEDYNVTLIDLQPCSTTAPVPAVSNMTSSSAYVTWMPTANATYRIRWRQGTTGAWQLQPLGYVELAAGQSWYTITGLLEQTAYQVQIQAKCGTTWGAFGASVNFTTPSLTYCNMTGTGTVDHISNVKVTPVNFPIMDNTSVQTNYISYTTPATLINLEVGSTGNQLSVSKAWTGTTSYADAVYAWIDFDRNGIFTDAERIMTSASSTTTPVTATFSVPNAVYTGNYTTTMRVVLKRGSAPVMCQDAVNGEVEDYAVRLRPCSNNTPTNVTTTAITHNSATIGWTSATNNNSFVFEYRPVTTPASAWTVINASVLGGNPPVQLTGLTPATLYEVRIAAKCGSTGVGTYTPVRQFTTRCDPTPPNVTVTNVTSNSAVVTWNPLVPSATYILRWREVGTGPWITVSAPALPQPPANSYTITGLDSFKTYEVQVANICNGETTVNPYSNPQVFTTVRLCQVAPPGLTITQLNPTSAVVIWDAFTGAGATGTYILRYRKVGIPSWTTVNVNTNTYTITGLLELTKYEMEVANVCSGTPGNFTPIYYFTTPTVVYCPMQSTTFASYVSKVTAKPTGKPEMINESTGSSYTDYTPDTTKFIEMVQGSTGNQIIIDKNLGSGAKAGVAVWIDFNRNGTFDLNERILADGPNENATASATFNVPADAFVSMTDYKYVVMRVALSKDAIPVNCTSFDDGEVEDYTVRISKQGVVNPLNQTDIMIYPNPVSSVLNVKNISKKANYKIYSASGQLVSSGIILNNKIDVSRLINGVYVIDIDDVQGTAQRKFIKE